LKRLRQAETLLWQGQIDAAKALFMIAPLNKLRNFINYLDKHCDRIVPVLPGRTDLFDWLWGGRISRQTN